MREEEEIGKGGGGSRSVCVCVCIWGEGRCFMVREFVFSRGGVSKCPVARSGLPQWGSGSLAVWYFTQKQTAGISAHTTFKVT